MPQGQITLPNGRVVTLANIQSQPNYQAPKFQEAPPQSQAQQQPQAQPTGTQEPQTSWFDTSSPAIDPTFEQAYKPYEDAWAKNFSQQAGSKQFQSLAEYEQFVKSLPGAGVEISAFIKKFSKQYMPAKVKREYDNLQKKQELYDNAQNEADVKKWKMDAFRSRGMMSLPEDYDVKQKLLKQKKDTTMEQLQIQRGYLAAKKAAEKATEDGDATSAKSYEEQAQRWASMMEGGTPQQAPATNTPAMSEMAQKALQQAMQNPNDPRSQQVIQMLRGMK